MRRNKNIIEMKETVTMRKRNGTGASNRQDRTITYNNARGSSSGRCREREERVPEFELI